MGRHDETPSRTPPGAGLTPPELVELLDHTRRVELFAEGPFWVTSVSVRRRRLGGYDVLCSEQGDGAGAPPSETRRLDRDGLSRFFEKLCAEGPVRLVGA